MIDLYRKLSRILDKRERRQAILVLILTFVVAVIEVLGVASIMPFMAVLANPGVINTNSVLSYLYTRLEFQSTDSFLFFLGVTVLVFLVGSTLLRAFVVWVQVYYANLRNYSISSRLVSGYLRKPYDWFLLHNSSQLATSIIEEVSRVVHGSLYPTLRLISHSLIALMMITLFIIVDPQLALGIAAFLGITYGAIFKFASKRLARIGRSVSQVVQQRLKAIQEAFGGIKDVKLGGLENAFLDRFRAPTKQLAFNNVSIKLWAEMPSFGMQALVFGGMMIVILYLMKTRGGLEDMIPVLAMYALGGYKLMPSLQEIYKQLAEIKGHQSALDTIQRDINLLNALYSTSENKNEKIAVNKCIELREIYFSYPETSKNVLDGISLKVTRNSTVGFVGGSGSGKTTTVDIMLGLLKPAAGELYVDDQLINDDNTRAWQRNLGYVAQQIFLTDDTISANIAFGIPAEDIKQANVERASRAANLHDFIENELPQGYNTMVGERGVRLSGGQRQRIGIARALYHDPDVLIFDEATSALDNITEKVVMDAVKELGHTKTIIMIAHRLSTVESCDELFLFGNGKVIAHGTYQELLQTNATFKEMAFSSQPSK